ncbi:uncharacterized protein LOC108864698 [Galendromus occidentalis]|uniref:Uncharacterized protein LOC108864698 n=1 Tax=Galendromus occidentalis TaxID=34638 RepID=A0AAJ7PAY4_9ACAR|nr:uncharacterized protein LOC108864698 [Galendromus occidentalis]
MDTSGIDEGPFACFFCPAEIRTRVGLKIHMRKKHPEKTRIEKAALAKAKMRRPAIIARGAPDLQSFAAAVKDRVGHSLAGDLPPLCCSDKFMKPVAVYVPIHLTEAESELMFRMSLGQGAPAPLPMHCPPHPQEQQFYDIAYQTALPAVFSTVQPEASVESFLNLDPNPVDLGLLNGVLEFVCNEPRLSDSPTVPGGGLAVSEEILRAIDLASHQVEVFEFKGDFTELVGRDVFLHDAGETVELHIPEYDGSMTVWKANRKMSGTLESAPSAENRLDDGNLAVV